MAGHSGHESHTPEWQRARQAGMHGRKGKFPLRDGQGTGLSSGWICTSLVGKCRRELDQAKFFEARGKLIKVQAKEPYKYTWTRRQSNAARQQRSHQKMTREAVRLATLFQWSSLLTHEMDDLIILRGQRKMGHQGFRGAYPKQQASELCVVPKNYRGELS